jgi:class 3 adenylate cyclase/tetratricopeptide (TPR) repeat protein
MPEGSGRSTDDELDDLLARAVLASQGVDPDDLAPVEPVSAPDAAAPEVAAPPTRDELRRLTIMFSDLVGSTPLSAQLDPETYRTVLSAYKDVCRRVIESELDGHLVHTRGDGMLAVFGYPTAHEDDALRAVKAGLEIHRQLVEVSAESRRRTGADLAARIGVHRGLVYVERDTEELYGFAVNVAARVQEAAEPGTVAISDEVRRLVDGQVWTVPLERAEMKGVERAPELHRVVEEQPRPTPGDRRWPTPLFGRAEALAALRARLEEARVASHPLATVIVGDAGVGKSRVVGAFLDELPRATPVLELGGSPFHQHQGLHPIREALRSWAQVPVHRPAAEQLAALRAHLQRRRLEHLLPLLAPVAGIGPEGGYEPVEADPRRLEALIGDAIDALLADWFAGRAGVVFVEDLHWLDPGTQAVLARLVATGPAQVLVVVTCRDDRSLGAPAERLALEPLDPGDCLELIRHHDADIPDAVALEVIGRSDGIPLFVEELVRSRHEVGEVDPAVDVSGDGSVPSALYEPLYARLNTLTDSRVVASAAASIGRTVPLDLLARVSGVTTRELDHAVTALMERRVLEPEATSDGRAVRFRHELVRLVAYELEPPSGRQRFHRLAAESLAEGELAAGADWSLIAEHHRRAGQPTSAAVALERAADDAGRRGSLEEARRHFDRALEVLLEAPAGAARDTMEIRLRLHRAFLAVSAEGFGSEHAALDYQRCLELSIEQPASAEMYQAMIAIWGYYINRSDLDRAWAVSTALRGLSQGSRSSMLPTNEAGFGMIEWYRGAFVEAARRLGDAVAAIDQVGAEDTSAPAAWSMALDPIASMHVHLGLALCWVGDVQAAFEQLDAARARCAALPFPLGPFSLAYVLLLDAVVRLQLDDPAAARADSREVLALSERHGFDAWLFWGSIVDRTLDGFDAPDDAASIAAEAAMSIEMWHAIGVRVHTASMRSLLARVLLEAGDRDGAMSAAKAALATADDTGSVASVPDSLLVLALAGPDGEREAALLEALALAESQGAVVSAVRIATSLVRNVGASHRPALERALARVVSDGGAPLLAAARAALDAA